MLYAYACCCKTQTTHSAVHAAGALLGLLACSFAFTVRSCALEHNQYRGRHAGAQAVSCLKIFSRRWLQVHGLLAYGMYHACHVPCMLDSACCMCGVQGGLSCTPTRPLPITEHISYPTDVNPRASRQMQDMLGLSGPHRCQVHGRHLGVAVVPQCSETLVEAYPASHGP